MPKKSFLYKRGFSSLIAGALVLGLILFGFTTLYFVSFKKYFEINAALTSRFYLMEDIIKTRVEILNDTINTTKGCSFYVKNVGETVQKLDCITVYVDKNLTDVSMVLHNDLDNPGLWDPDEILEISFINCPSLGTHIISISLCNGVKAKRYINFVA